MTDLSKLTVSLTKEGAHKAFYLLRALPIKEVLDNVSETAPNGVAEVNIDRAQTANILSANSSGALPQFWQSAKALSEDALKHLVFLAIIYSHHKLISAFQEGADGLGKGALNLGAVLDGKNFSNIKNEIVALGLSTSSSVKSVEYDLSPILESGALGELASQLLTLKLKKAGWDGSSDVADEAIRLGLHLAISQKDENAFRGWLKGGKTTVSPDGASVHSFEFVEGHNAGKEGHTRKQAAPSTGTIEFRHNELQNLLYLHLAKTLGDTCVGTELSPGYGDTSIDVVTVVDKQTTFYEIKTASSMRLCVREALSQLLEYAYWPNAERCHQLIVVAEAKSTEDGRAYMTKLREKFGIPVFYSQIDGDTGELGPLT